MTQQEIANHFGVTRRTVINWGKKGAPLKGGLLAIQRWVDEQKGGTPAATMADAIPGIGLKDRLTLAQAEHYETKTKLAELEHRVRMGELVTLEAVEELLRRWYGPISDYLRSQPERLAARVNPSDPEHARQVLAEERAAVFKLAKETIHADAG